MSRPVYLDAWRLDVTPTAKLLAVRIEAYQGGRDGWCYAASTTLGAEIGVTADTVRVALGELRSCGALLEHVVPGRPTRRRLTRVQADTTTRERTDTTPVSNDPANPCPPGHTRRKKTRAPKSGALGGAPHGSEPAWLD